MALLYDQFGRPIESANKRKPDHRPLSVAPLLDSNRDYVTDGLTPEVLASIYKEADQGNIGRQAELFDQLEEKDGHLLCEREKRVNGILNLDFEIEPAGDDPRDVKVAEFVQSFFDNLADWDDDKVAMQDAVGKGFACIEQFWDVSEGQALPLKFDTIPQKRFRFTDKSGILRRYPLLLSDEHTMGEEIPAWRVVMHQYGGKTGNPVRAKIYRVASWMVLFKHYSIKDWVVFSEVFGMPLRLGKYGSGATDDDKDALYNAISSLGSDAAGIISRETEIEFIETAKRGSADLYKAMATFCNAENSKAILGQTLSAEVGDKGSYAASKTHDGIRVDLLKADGRALAATIRDQIIRPIVGFNFGWDTALPKYTSTLNTPDNLNKKSEWVDKVTSKVAVPAKWLRDQFNIPEPQKGEEMVGGPQTVQPVAAKMVVAKEAPATDEGITFAPGGEAIQTIQQQALAETDLDPLMDQVKELLDKSETLEEFRDNLSALFENMDLTELAGVMQRAFVLAELSGRYDQSQEG